MGIKIIFTILMILDFLQNTIRIKENSIKNIVFAIIKFFVFIIIVANREFF